MHRPPILGRWLVDELTHESNLSASLTTRQSGRSMRAIVQAQGKDPTNVGRIACARVRVWNYSTPKRPSQL